jgi:hypothetical protein
MGAQYCKNFTHSIRCGEHDECCEDIFAICCCLSCECIYEKLYHRENYTSIKYQNEF